MAQEVYGFFDSSGEDTRSYSAAEMATAFHTLASDGVAALGTNLEVTAEGSTMRVLVGYGTAMIRGYYYQLRNDGGGVLAVEHTTEAALSRIDRIVLRLNLTTRTIALGKRIGTAASTPAAPALTRTDEIYELSLATVYIGAGASEILPGNITDDRANDGLCGLIAPESLRRGDIQAMIDDNVDAAIAESEAGFADVIRFGAQTLTAAQKTQARFNVGSQASITATGVLKGDGSGGVSAAVAGTDYQAPTAILNNMQYGPLLGTAVNNKEYRCTQAGITVAPTMTIPAITSAEAEFAFTVIYKAPNTTPPVVTNNSGYTIKYKGDDVLLNVFTPVTGKIYHLAFLFDGIYLNCFIVGVTP